MSINTYTVVQAPLKGALISVPFSLPRFSLLPLPVFKTRPKLAVNSSLLLIPW